MALGNTTPGSIAARAFEVLTRKPFDNPLQPAQPSPAVQQASYQPPPIPMAPTAPTTPGPTPGPMFTPTPPVQPGMNDVVNTLFSLYAGPTSPGVTATTSTRNPPRTGPLPANAPNTDEYQGLNPNKYSQTWRDVDLQGYDYLKLLNVATADREKILDQVRMQAQMLNATDLDLPAIYNQLLPQYADAANQIKTAAAAEATATSQRTARMAQIQAYLMPQFNKFLQSAQQRADAYGATNNDPSYGMYQSQANAAYAAQLAALTSQASLGTQQQAPQLTLDDVFKQVIAQQPPIPVKP